MDSDDRKRRVLLAAIAQDDTAAVEAATGTSVVGRQEAGRLSKEELLFRHFDADGDGLLNCGEFVVFLKATGFWAANDYDDGTFEATDWPEECSDLDADPTTGITMEGWVTLYADDDGDKLDADFTAAFPDGDPQVRLC